MTIDASTSGLPEQLSAWAQAHVDPTATVVDVVDLPGNSGVGCGFDVVLDGAPVRRLVIRLAPPGVARRGNTDVLRQVPLLHALDRAGIPIARLVWSTDDPRWFGTDALIQEWVAGRPLHMTDAGQSVAAARAPDEFVLGAVDVLTDIHQVDWRELLPADWAEVETVDAGVARWLRVLHAAPHPDIVHRGDDLAAALLARRPQQVRVGLYHGDYQTNNILFAPDARVEAVVDWEIAGVGSVAIDAGWLSVMTDPSCWGPEHARKLLVDVDPEAIRERYDRVLPLSRSDFRWFRAYAAFSFASIAAYNLKLHRTGRRPDALYEEMASSVPALVEFALASIS